MPNFNVTSWNALYAPAGTPQPIIDKLNAALREVLADPDLKKRALDLGIDAKASTPAELDALMRSDIDKWTKVIDKRIFPSNNDHPNNNARRKQWRDEEETRMPGRFNR